jgi:Gas vesicle protein K
VASGRAQDRLLAGGRSSGLFEGDFENLRARLSTRVNADRDELEKGLAQLVMTLIELLRQLMERQALHRMEAGSLTEQEVERLGRTFMALSQRMDELKEAFGLTDEDLNLNLGPLGNLM